MFFKLILLLAVLLSSLTAGFLFGFAVVVMPGIHNLQNREFVLAFQNIDGIIQRGQPLFGLVWAGSVLALIVAAVMGIGRLEGFDRLLLIGSTAVYLLGVQLPTMTVNVPLNNALQQHEVATMGEQEIAQARGDFESRWNLANVLRTVLAVLVTTALILLVFRL